MNLLNCTTNALSISKELPREFPTFEEMFDRVGRTGIKIAFFCFKFKFYPNLQVLVAF